MPKTRRRHPDWKRGDRADVTIPPAELLSNQKKRKETRMRYDVPNDSSCLDVTIVVVVRDVRQAEETRNVVFDHPANSREDGVALFSNSLQHGRHAAADIGFFVKGQILGREKKNGDQKFGWTEICPFIYWLPFMRVCVLERKKRSENRGLTKTLKSKASSVLSRHNSTKLCRDCSSLPPLIHKRT